MKQIYISSDHTEYVFTVSARRALFKALAQLFHSFLHIDEDKLGTDDIILSYPQLSDFKQVLGEELEKRIPLLEPVKDMPHCVRIFDKLVYLNIRNEDHHALYSLGVIMQMVEKEYELQGNIYFYTITDLDEANINLLKYFKYTAAESTLDSSYNIFISTHKDFQEMKENEFKERIAQLVKDRYLEYQEENASWPVRPAIKSINMKMI